MIIQFTESKRISFSSLPLFHSDIQVSAIVKISNSSTVSKIYSTVFSELPWINAKCKEIFPICSLISFIELSIFKEHASNAIAMNVIGYVIPDTTMDTKTNIVA